MNESCSFNEAYDIDQSPFRAYFKYQYVRLSILYINSRNDMMLGTPLAYNNLIHL